MVDANGLSRESVQIEALRVIGRRPVAKASLFREFCSRNQRGSGRRLRTHPLENVARVAHVRCKLQNLHWDMRVRPRTFRRSRSQAAADRARAAPLAA